VFYYTETREKYRIQNLYRSEKILFHKWANKIVDTRDEEFINSLHQARSLLDSITRPMLYTSAVSDRLSTVSLRDTLHYLNVERETQEAEKVLQNLKELKPLQNQTEKNTLSVLNRSVNLAKRLLEAEKKHLVNFEDKAFLYELIPSMLGMLLGQSGQYGIHFAVSKHPVYETVRQNIQSILEQGDLESMLDVRDLCKVLFNTLLKTLDIEGLVRPKKNLVLKFEETELQKRFEECVSWINKIPNGQETLTYQNLQKTIETLVGFVENFIEDFKNQRDREVTLFVNETLLKVFLRNMTRESGVKTSNDKYTDTLTFLSNQYGLHMLRDGKISGNSTHYVTRTKKHVHTLLEASMYGQNSNLVGLVKLEQEEENLLNSLLSEQGTRKVVELLWESIKTQTDVPRVLTDALKL